MVRALGTRDFRAVRHILEPSDFALGSDEPDSPPSDLVEQSVWHGIVDLPDDVAIRTTSHQGARVGILYELISGWTMAVPDGGIVAYGMLDSFDCFQAALFNLTHGFYKEAIFGLRSALETMTFGATCALAQDHAAWQGWLRGDELRFSKACARLQTLAPLSRLEPMVLSAVGGSLVAGDDGKGRNAWARRAYGRLSEFAHARANASNAELWSSNGPIYSAKGFALGYHSFLEVYALALLLAKLGEPTLKLVESAQDVFCDENRSLYLTPPFSAVCGYYAHELFPEAEASG